MKTKKLFMVSYVPVDKIDEILTIKSTQLVSYAFILHDKDVYLKDIFNDDGILVHKKGDPEINHCHIYVNLKMSREPQEVVNWFKCVDINGQAINTFAEKVFACQSAVDYLTHKNNPEKFQYSVDEVYFGGNSIKKDENGNLISLDTILDESYDIVECMLNKMPLKEMVRIFGKNFIYHYANYKLLVNDIGIEDDLKNQIKNMFAYIDSLEEKNKVLQHKLVLQSDSMYFTQCENPEDLEY